MSKSNRKRAADFLDDENPAGGAAVSKNVTAQQAKKSKKSMSLVAEKKLSSSGPTVSKKSGNKSLTVDGVNGVIEHSSDSEVEITTGDVAPAQSLMGEGLHTAEKEIEADSGSDNEEADQGAALLAGFDSDTEDIAEDKDLDLSKTAAIPNYKKTSKKLRNAAQKGSSGPGSVYVGRIPHGFYEKQMREYFSQFGDITRLRLSRNRRTGASKHFAFIEFASDEVAKIVAETMDNYLMFGHILKCKYAPADNLHPDIWKGANKKFRKIPHQKLERQKLEAPKTVEMWEKKNRKEEQKRKKNAAKLAEIGYKIALPTLKSPSTALRNQRSETKTDGGEKVVNGEITESTNPAAAEPVAKRQKKEKKDKVNTTASNPLTEGNLGVQNAGNSKKEPKQSGPVAASSSKATTATTAASSTPSGKKSKKSGKSKVSSDMGEYDQLSSIPIGIDAAGDVSAQGGASLSQNDLGDINTVHGVADAELKKRKKDRKRARVVEPTADQEAAADVNEIAPFAQDANNKTRTENAKTKPQKVKSILKNKA